MKKLISMLLAAVILVTVLPMGILAAEEPQETVSYIYYEDGSYLKITVTTTESASRLINSVSGSKKMEYTDSDGDVYWTAVLRGSFTYNGTTSVCTASSCDVTFHNDAYYLDSKEVSKSGNTAYATFSVMQTLFGTPIFKNTYELSMSCDKNGNLS